jgi:hypothetical protein
MPQSSVMIIIMLVSIADARVQAMNSLAVFAERSPSGAGCFSLSQQLLCTLGIP